MQSTCPKVEDVRTARRLRAGARTALRGLVLACLATAIASTQALGAEVKPPDPVGAFKLDRAPEQGGLSLGWKPAGATRVVVDGREIALAKDGRFLVGFGRDYAASTVMVATFADGRTVREAFAVAKRAWQIEYLPTVQKHPQPEPEFLARRPGELAQIDAARQMNPDTDGWRQTFVWPAKGRISGQFGSQRVYAGEAGAPHAGVDIAGPAGARVVAPADGVVTLAAASPFTLEGNLLMISHGMGLDSAFLHLSKIYVKKGDVVRQGQLVGTIGMTGRATGPHLHWGMKWKDQRIDPQPLAGKM